MGNVYIGNSSGKAAKLKNAYIGINGVSRKIKAIYVGVNGVAKLVWNGGKRALTKYLHYNMGSIPAKLYNIDGTRQHSASIINYKNSQLPCGFICNAYSSYNDSTGTTYYYNSIQRFSLDDNYNLTNIGRVPYNRSWGGTRYDGSWYESTKTVCDFYNELGDYLFMGLRTVSDGDTIKKYYAIKDWSGNEICTLDQSKYGHGWDSDIAVASSGVAFSNSTMVVGVASYSEVALGVITFNGSNLTQTYYYPKYIDSNGTSYDLRTINHSVSVVQLDNNIGIMAFQGATEQYSDISVGGSIAIAFRLNNDGSITFGRTMYVKEGYSGSSSTNTGILIGIDKNHAVMYDNYYSSGSGYYYYSKKWFALYVDDNLNISITDRYDFYDKTDIYNDEDFPVGVIGKSKTFGVADTTSYTDSSKSGGLYLYTVDTNTHKFVDSGGKLLPQSSNIPSNKRNGIYHFSALGDDKIIYPYHTASANNATTTDLYAFVGKFE